MAQVKVDVPDSVLGDAKEKELKSLRSKVSRQETKIRELEVKLSAYKAIHESVARIRQMVIDEMDNLDPYWFQNYEL